MPHKADQCSTQHLFRPWTNYYQQTDRFTESWSPAITHHPQHKTRDKPLQIYTIQQSGKDTIVVSLDTDEGREQSCQTGYFTASWALHTIQRTTLGSTPNCRWHAYIAIQVWGHTTTQATTVKLGYDFFFKKTPFASLTNQSHKPPSHFS